MGLPCLLCHGAPTGVRERVPASGVWPWRTECGEDWFDEALEMLLCDFNHVSADKSVDRVRE